MPKQQTYTRGPKQVIRIQRRVLKLVDIYLAAMDQDTLHGAGGGIMTIRELRQHVAGPLKQLRVKPGWEYFE